MKSENFKKFNIDEQFEISVKEASELFFAGKIFIYPTDTIYGIGGNPFNEQSVKRINHAKGRDTNKRFIWLVNNMNILLSYVEINYESHLDFLRSIFPAPITVILNLNARTKKIVGSDSAAFRVPDNQFCNKLLTEIGFPLISTSVNRSGKSALNDYVEIEQEFSNDIDALFYSKTKNIPLASTIIDLKNRKPVLIREGAIKFVDLLNKFN